MARFLPALPGLRKRPPPADERKVVLADYYSALATSGIYSSYRARPWPVERAVSEAYERIIWVFKSVQAISTTASRLPYRIKDGEKELDDHPLYRVINKRANPLETGRQFRQRLCSQVLLSKRGAFVELTRSRGGEIMRMDLLPPGRTRPIPVADPQPGPDAAIIDHYEVIRADGSIQELDPESVRWFREPHPLDPLSGVTPLEAAGLSVELDFFTRLYNISFLRNDGRPGGVLAIDGEMNEAEMDRVESRFGTGPTEAGKLTVINGEVSYVDLATRPRDMAYEVTAQVSKTEILTAFGVPESLLGFSADRCLRGSELIRLADGSRVTALSVVGRTFKVMVPTPHGHVEADAWATQESVSPIFRVTTESGRQLETNGRHPLYAALKTKNTHGTLPKIDIEGWTPVEKLARPPSEGEWLVAVPSRITPAEHNDLTPDEGFVMGALVGDGSISGSGTAYGQRQAIALTTPEGDFPDEFIRAVEAMGDQVTRYRTKDRVAVWGVRATPAGHVRDKSGHCHCRTCLDRAAANVRARKRGEPPRRAGRPPNQGKVRALLAEAGLLGTTSHTKFIPEVVFGADNKTLAAFLGGLYAADGCVTISKANAKYPTRRCTIYLVTVSERLARDVQEALLRFGVNARLRRRRHRGGLPSMAGKIYDSWSVEVTAAADVREFAAAIRIPGKQEALEEADRVAARQLARKPHGGARRWRTRDLHPDLRWEKLKSIEQIAVEPTVGVAVPGHHHYLSLLWEHNTYSNAEQEHYNFFTITMPPVLDLLATGFDEDSDDNLEGFFDTSGVEVLQRSQAKVREEARREFELGLISPDEYRDRAGYEEIDLPKSRALWLPTGKQIVATSKEDAKKIAEEQAPVMPGVPGAGPGGLHGIAAATAAAMGGAKPPTGPGQVKPGQPVPTKPPDPALAAQQADPKRALRSVKQASKEVKALPATEPPAEPAAAEASRAVLRLVRATEHKSLGGVDQLESVTDEQALARLETTLSATLAALIIRLVERTAARAASPKARKGTRHWTTEHKVDTRHGDQALDAAKIVEEERWRQEARQAIAPLVQAGAAAAASGLLVDLHAGDGLAEPAAIAASQTADTVTAMVGDAAAAQAIRLAGLINQADQSGATADQIVTQIRERAPILTRWAESVAGHAATAATAGARDVSATLLAQGDPQRAVSRQWRARRDTRTRDDHRDAHGQHQPLGEPFEVGEALLRYPGDPLGPPGQTINCRCIVNYRAESGQYAAAPAAS